MLKITTALYPNAIIAEVCSKQGNLQYYTQYTGGETDIVRHCTGICQREGANRFDILYVCKSTPTERHCNSTYSSQYLKYSFIFIKQMKGIGHINGSVALILVKLNDTVLSSIDET